LSTGCARKTARGFLYNTFAHPKLIWIIFVTYTLSEICN